MITGARGLRGRYSDFTHRYLQTIWIGECAGEALEFAQVCLWPREPSKDSLAGPRNSANLSDGSWCKDCSLMVYGMGNEYCSDATTVSNAI